MDKGYMMMPIAASDPTNPTRNSFSSITLCVLTAGLLGLFAACLALPALAVTEMDGLPSLQVLSSAPRLLSEEEGDWVSSPEWVAFQAITQQDWSGTFNEAARLPHRAFPARFDAAAAAGLTAGSTDRTAREALLDASAVDRMSRKVYDLLSAAFPDAPFTEDLRPLAIEKRGNVWWAIYQQTLGGLPIEGARADFRYSSDGQLLSMGLDLVPQSALSVARPADGSPLDAAAAERAALESLGRGGIALAVLSPSHLSPLPSSARQEREAWVAETPSRETSLVYVPRVVEDGRGLEVRAAWLTRTEVSDPPARFASWIDASTGEVLRRENEFRYETILGHSDGDVQMEQPTDPYVTRSFSDLRVNVSGVGEAFTNANGDYSITAPNGLPRLVTSALNGRFASIQDALGTPPAFSGTATPGVPLNVHWSDSNSDAAERDCFYHANVIHTYMKGIDPAFSGTDYEMTVNVNLNQTCNAYWDGIAINFFRSGGGCANTGQIPDVVYHEYGHGVSQFVYAPASPSGSEHEGFSDYIAATMTDQPLIGRGFYGPNTVLRTCDNNRQYPAPECGGEPHCEGEVIAAALWHMRQNLVTSLGHDPGVTLSDHLFHFARFGRQTSFEGYYFDVLAVDDNNGTLIDGTPHAAAIIAAFDRHNIGPGWALEVLHTPLSDTENGSLPIPVLAVFSSAADLRGDSLAVYYSTTPVGGGPVNGPHRLAMAPTANLREYQASIPPQPLGTRVRYFVSAHADTLGLRATSPAGAPLDQHTFVINADNVVPVIAHAPLFNKSEAIWPVQVPATVTDNQAVSNVQVEWKLNGVDQTAFGLPRVGESDLFRGPFNAAAAAGNQILYRIKATDAALIPNVAYQPASGYLSFDIVHDLVEDGEHGGQDWTHALITQGFNDQWHLSTRRNHTTGGTTSWKFGDTGNGVYLDSGDGALVSPPVVLRPAASLRFWHWIAAESEGATGAWDGAIAQITTDGGTTWSSITPQGGYTHAIIANPASPFPAGTPCWSGRFDWRQVQFDLAAFNGRTVQIRLRFGSDGYVTDEGWYIDDLVLNPGLEPGAVAGPDALPARSGLISVSPNPFNPRALISFAVASPERRVQLDILDVTGRRVRVLADTPMASGIHTLVWNGRSDGGEEMGSGVYFAKLRVGGEESSLKVVLMK